MKVDIYAHFITQKVIDAFVKRVGNMEIVGMRPDEGPNPKWFDIDIRIEILEKFPDLVEVLIPTGQPLEYHSAPEDAAYVAKLYNDELAGLVNKYPDKFIGAVACLPLNNIKVALKEIDRTIKELGFKGIMMHTPVNGRPMDSEEYMPIYERMSSYNLPIWIHPTRHNSFPDYSDGKASKYALYHAFGWPYETSVAMIHLVCSGILMKYPGLKFITHHAGGMIPFFAGRISQLNPEYNQEILSKEELKLMKSPIEQLRMFYNDTALYGNTPALMCANAFFGADHLLFGTDVPYGPGVGEGLIKMTIDAVDNMNISAADKKKIYDGNAKALLSLDI
jgi:predicted TIM-barrel fold metal-dependent hydrolase